MELRSFSILVFCSLNQVCFHHPLSFPSSGLHECRKNLSLPALEVLPGGGWDNLRNLDMGRVMKLSYSQCQTTEDGVYLIPDEVFVIPRKTSQIESNSEVISSWLQQRSSTSFSINSDISYDFVLNAKFSAENQRMKTHQVRGGSVTARVEMRNHLYTVRAYPDFTLDPGFVRQAKDIADAIESNQTDQADYLSERLILDYGTHVITNVDAGATLVNEDYVKTSYVSSNEESLVTASAALNFFYKVKVGIDTNYSYNTAEIRNYQDNLTYSVTLSHGGTVFYPGTSLQKWQESTLNNLVAIDHAGLPIYYFLSPAMLPNLPFPTVNKLALSVQQAANRYYDINKHPGCLNPGSKHFNFQANANDDSCEGPAANISFGGVYQQCTSLTENADSICQAQAQKNPATGDYSCKQPYIATLLRSEIYEEGYSEHELQEQCDPDCWFFCCEEVSVNVHRTREARIDTYWCSTDQEASKLSGYLFGGLYGPSLQNPLTKSNSCPPHFLPQKLLSNGLMVCLSADYETGTKYSVPFGGFFSCQATNPLAKDKSRCPPQFSQHLAVISDGCQVQYCVQSDVFTERQFLPIHLPPFTQPPVMKKLVPNKMAVRTEGGHTWFKAGVSKMWKMAKPEEVGQMFKMSEPSYHIWYGVALGFTALIALVMIVVVLVMKKRKRSPTQPPLE